MISTRCIKDWKRKRLRMDMMRILRGHSFSLMKRRIIMKSLVNVVGVRETRMSY